MPTLCEPSHARTTALAAFARRTFIWPVLLGSIVGCGPSENHAASRPSAPDVFVLQADITISGTYPDKPPDVLISLNVLDPEQTPTTLTADQMYLFQSPGAQPVATLHGAIDPGQLDFSTGQYEGTYFDQIQELNRDLSAACSATDLELDLRGGACACPFAVKHSVHVLCTPDARAGSLLDDPGLPAPANKPCDMKEYTIAAGVQSLSEEHRYRYDSAGRLRFLDVYDATGVFTERRVYTYDASGYLQEKDTVSPDTRLITSRKTYSYGSSGLLSEVLFDGEPSFDGVTDWTTTYSLTGSQWSETLVYADPSNGTRSSSYTYDAVNLTLTGSDGNVVQFAAPLVSPNQVFAMPEEVETPKILSSGGAPYTYDANGLLTSVSYPSFAGSTLQDDYFYTCP